MSLDGGRYPYGGSDARQIAELVTRNVVTQLGLRDSSKPSDSPKIVTKACPSGMVGCNVANARRLGLECPLPELAGQRWLMVTTDGSICTLPRLIDGMRDLTNSGRGRSVDEAIEAVSAQLLEANPDLVARLLTSTRSNPTLLVSGPDGGNSVRIGADKAKKLEQFPVKEFFLSRELPATKEEESRGFSKISIDNARNIIGEAKIEAAQGKPAEGKLGFLLAGDAPIRGSRIEKSLEILLNPPSGGKPRDTRFGQLWLGAAAASDEEVEMLRYLRLKYPDKKFATPDQGLGGGATGRRSSSRRSSSRSSSPSRESSVQDESGLTMRLDALKSDLGNDINTIATFRTQECPVSYDNSKWVAAKGSYSECERRMGFRWVSPQGHCYPEGLCSIRDKDRIDTAGVVQNKVMLLTTLTQAHNLVLKQKRDAMLAKKELELMEAFKRTPEGKRRRQEGETFKASDFRSEALDMLPENFRLLPEEGVVTDIDNLLSAVGPNSPDSLEEETSFAKQAFLQAFSQEVARRGSAEGTPASDALVNKFVRDSIFCTKANTMFTGPMSQEQIKTMLASTPDSSSVTVGSTCAWLPLENGGFFMPKTAASRATGGGASSAFEKQEIIRGFKSGQDPLAKAFRFISERFLERTESTNSVIKNAYSPMRSRK